MNDDNAFSDALLHVDDGRTMKDTRLGETRRASFESVRLLLQNSTHTARIAAQVTDSPLPTTHALRDRTLIEVPSAKPTRRLRDSGMFMFWDKSCSLVMQSIHCRQAPRPSLSATMSTVARRTMHRSST